jgi:hypothetical protein
LAQVAQVILVRHYQEAQAAQIQYLRELPQLRAAVAVVVALEVGLV